MPEPLDREAFLRSVADSVDLQRAEVGEVLEELSGHLSDAAAGLRDAGYSAEDAERRAIRSMGDPGELGRELGKARHRRRHLLNAVGGTVFSSVAFGLWSWLFLWLFLGTLGILGVLLAGFAIRAAGGDYGSIMAGPAASAATVAITILWLAWFGWVLPARVARWARLSVRGVQRAVGIVGFVLTTVLLWTCLDLRLDPVLAVGLPLAPVAFLLASQRPSRDTLVFPRTTFRIRVTGALAVILGVTAVGMATATPPRETWWSGDMTRIGADLTTEAVLAPAEGQAPMSVDWGDVPSDRSLFASLAVPDGVSAAAFEARFATFQLEIWPVTLTGNQLAFGPAPIAVSSTAAVGDMRVWIDLPVPRAAVRIAPVAVLVARDGRRVIVGEGGPNTTPAWSGTLADWWFTSR